MIVPKVTNMVPPLPSSARPSSAAPKASVHEPVKASGGPSINKRPISAIRSVNRYIKSE